MFLVVFSFFRNVLSCVKSESMFKKIALAISGGVDSAVSALILKNKGKTIIFIIQVFESILKRIFSSRKLLAGFNVIGTFIRFWDNSDNNDDCSILKDRESAEWICNRLDVPFLEINFVKEYWTNVFELVMSSLFQYTLFLVC